jgi:hypothetical protein
MYMAAAPANGGDGAADQAREPRPVGRAGGEQEGGGGQEVGREDDSFEHDPQRRGYGAKIVPGA